MTVKEVKSLKYSFHPKELNNWKARITERLVQCYIKDNIIPKLKEEQWDDVIYTSGWFKAERSKDSPFTQGLFAKYENKTEERILLGYGFFPTKAFLKKFKKLTSLLENIPDGFLIKLRRTGTSRSREEAIQEFGLNFQGLSFQHFLGTNIFGSRHHVEMFIHSKSHEDKLLPVVDGEVEVIEVKSGKSNLPPSQKRSYRNILREGYVLRFFHVEIISFEDNKFEIEEKLIKNPAELKTFPLKKKELVNS